MNLRPGGPLTGFLIAACFALIAQVGVMGAEAPIWDDVVFLTQDTRIRDLSNVFTAWTESYFGPLRPNEMYRPVVNVSFTIDWWLSGSEPGDVNLAWFHFVNLALHAANAGLAYLFLANLVARPLGAPLIGACLFAVHPLAVEPTSWLVGRCDLFATFFGLIAGICLLRSPRDARLLIPAVLAYGLSLFAKASMAPLPLVVALGVVAYRGLPPMQLLTWRHMKRFVWFVIPAVVWFFARGAVLGTPFPSKGGLAWHENVTAMHAAQGVGRATWILLGKIVLPVGLCGDYSTDPAWDPATTGGGPASGLGILLLVTMAVIGVVWLRRKPKIAFPLLALVVFLIPVLQVVRIGAIVADRFAYLPMLFPMLLVGEGLERGLARLRSPSVPALAIVLAVSLGVLSHARADVWRNPVTFGRDVLRSYPENRTAMHWMAIGLSDRGDNDEAIVLLRDAVERIEDPGDELSILGALLVEENEFEEAERVLRRAVDASVGNPRLSAQSRYNLAVVLKNTDRPDEARGLLVEALEHQPGNETVRALLEKLSE